MKKIFKVATLIVMLFFATNADAQWRMSKIEADELKRNEERHASIYYGEEGYATFWSDDPLFKIGLNEGCGIFSRYGTTDYVHCIIGLYVDGKLVKRYPRIRFFVGEGLKAAVMAERWGVAQKIIEHLQKKGDVRILAPRYAELDFDLRIPMNKDLKYDPPQAPLFY